MNDATGIGEHAMQEQLFGYSREKAIDLYRRVKEWERKESQRLNDTILVPLFGGNGCRMHNFMVSCAIGKPDDDLRKLKSAKYYEWKQRQIWDTANRLQQHFAQFF